jgi:hypothetical protein
MKTIFIAARYLVGFFAAFALVSLIAWGAWALNVAVLALSPVVAVMLEIRAREYFEEVEYDE